MLTQARSTWLPEDDELLIIVREENMQCTWEELAKLFNNRVANARYRSANAIKKRMNK